ncbi:hypothetical protein LTR17_007134 [Elasticomyces elasticus]|nr:hypothetical protein LTR17_007134 [Elasticomyces elasticus]
MHLLGITGLALSCFFFAAAAPTELRNGVVPRTDALQKRQNDRVQFFDQRDSELDPMDAEDQERTRVAFRQAIALANAATRLPRDSPLYATFFRDDSQYFQVMNIFQQVGNLLTDNSNAETIVFVRSNRPPGTPTTALAETQQNRILLFDSFFDLEPFRPFIGSNIGVNILMGSDAGVLLHELVHFLSANRMRTVVGNLVTSWINRGTPRFRIEDAPFVRTQWGTAILDVDPANFAIPSIPSDVTLSTILRSGGNGPRAYGLSRTLGLAQLNLGAFATALNADSYVALAVTAFINWAFTNFEPDVNPPVFTTRQQISAWRNIDEPDEDESVDDVEQGSSRATLNLHGDNIPDRWNNSNDENNHPGPSAGSSGGRYVGASSGHYQEL